MPDAFIGTMAQLLVALETGKEPEISGRDNLKTMALVEAAYLSAEQSRMVSPDEIEHSSGLMIGKSSGGFFGRLSPSRTEELGS